jgi:hypothetical protein
MPRESPASAINDLYFLLLIAFGVDTQFNFFDRFCRPKLFTWT